MHIEPHQLNACCEYIQQQMEKNSWWPTQAPGEAKEQFELMKGSTLGLGQWCERWLDEGQLQKLSDAIRD